MKTINIKKAIQEYEKNSHCRRPINYEDYKKRRAEIEKLKQQQFRYIPEIADIYVWYDADVEYQFELDRLQYLWYFEYRKDFAYRYDQMKLWDDDDDDWYWYSRCYIID